ncbi:MULTISPECIES: cytochrome c biogenesis protein CcdA [unclassified Pseudodesulfovibrio]|uniref:protein-disulfide reductase DsbD family protein n=1 Tax=unclassified Pseudodesulfovibrio TaxID=2661612 RepID=UPI000FEBBAE2|nr:MULTISPECIES: cytochrome c biogenesis protein CcdA [unclassified Pseudodesulfovibrio]MCJ2164011.1 thioredoxin domain-containing protein [Pseudodesulfovibrio sp. S3-i]RWU05352.1 cytochrome C biogenesis protein [Pseudodesulfovibrio sp. S3]
MPVTKPLFSLLLTVALSLVSSMCYAQIQPSSLPMETRVEGYAIPMGTLGEDEPGAILLAVTLNIEDDWYAYSNIPGEVGKPTQLTAATANGSPLKVFYPEGVQKPDSYDPSVTVTAFLHETVLFVLIPRGMESPFPVTMNLDLLLCHPTKCVPGRLELQYGETNLDATSLPPADERPWWQEFQQQVRRQAAVQPLILSDADEMKTAIIQWQFTPEYLQPGLEVGSLLSAVLMGLLAGLILNIMPCVLPVVSLKLSSLLSAGADSSEDPTRAFREHNIFFVLGVLTFFLFLAVVLGSTGSAWGALFQNRWLVLGVAAIMGALGLSLFGLFHLPVVDLKFGAGHDSPRKQAFFTGMLTTLLATPCSGPFLGGVLGWALIQGPMVIATVFFCIGLGMSTPYLLLILNPKLARFLPKSGPWIKYVEKGIAFFLLGTAFYLVAIAVGSGSLRILAPLWAVLFGGWLWLQTRNARGAVRGIIRLGALCLLAAAVVWTTPAQHQTNPWDSFDPVTLSQTIGNETLLVEFTADWCPTCKVLEATVMTNENVISWETNYAVRFIKVDMTQRDPEAEALLLALGSRSLPTAAVFKKGQGNTPLVIRDLFTAKQLESILKSL